MRQWCGMQRAVGKCLPPSLRCLHLQTGGACLPPARRAACYDAVGEFDKASGQAAGMRAVAAWCRSQRDSCSAHALVAGDLLCHCHLWPPSAAGGGGLPAGARRREVSRAASEWKPQPAVACLSGCIPAALSPVGTLAFVLPTTVLPPSPSCALPLLSKKLHIAVLLYEKKFLQIESSASLRRPRMA